jgi:hypothetical protein
VDPDGETPRSSITLLNGYMQANYKEMDHDVGFSNRTTVGATEGMVLSIAPGSKVQLKIDGIESKINIQNNGDSFFLMDVDSTVNDLTNIISPLESSAYQTWAEYGELGMEAMNNLLVTGLVVSLSILNIVLPGSEHIPLDALAQPIGESFAGSTIDDLNNYFESLQKVIDARVFLKEPFKIEIE